MQTQIWDKKAQSFPRFTKNNEEVLEILHFFQKNGMDFFHKTLIDIGCGNGRFALHFAEKAKHIYATDLSQMMLNHLLADAKELGLNNITILANAWQQIKTTDLAPIQISFACMTPAMNTKEAFLKAYHLCTECMCYVGFGRFRKNPLLEKIFALHKIDFELPTGLPQVLQWLQEEDINTPPIIYKQQVLERELEPTQAIKDIQWHIQIHNQCPDNALIQDYVNHLAKKGKILYTQEREIGLAYLQKPKML
ncbi:hypothetical protein CCZ01_02140 [Helicobacter monodelphidis]|uniref:class I SAM-dependent methyltransferase n=1 Tax=Helicobacter sp. 15-1451 TaxID=2004995 RepID=UPI000DCB3188|nr:class I SAM-dependent methyltransferase [Helicobacter sp. 15-1451]RAX58607.1 hypothetical protein CCZ01_02140 [Helicobacter sp. 15-1451]